DPLLNASLDIGGSTGAFAGFSSSPVDLHIIDPQGGVLDENTGQMPDASYVELDFGDDGHVNDQFYVPAPIPGTYHLRVYPEAIAQQGDTYSIDIWYGEQWIRLAHDAPMPAQGGHDEYTLVLGPEPDPEIILISVVSYLDVESSFEMIMPRGWSMVSLPVNPDDPSASSLFPDSVVIYGYEKGKGYVRVKETGNLEVGRGYWILFNDEQTYILTGRPIQKYTLPVNENGWLMIGGCISEAQASTDNVKIGVIYGNVQGSGYQRITKSEGLTPGKGYWILLNNITQQAGLTVEVR
ncbi:MAG: hypothetical protein ACMUHX_01425, partial [bacterium]